MATTIEKAQELKDDYIDEAFEGITTLTLADAIRLGSKNSKQAVGWGSGDNQCALHAGVTAAVALGFIETD